MFQEIFDWTDFNDKQSQPIRVSEGDVITAEVTYLKDTNSYLMTMNSTGTSKAALIPTNLSKRLRNRPHTLFWSINQMTAANFLPTGVGWTNIQVDVNYQPVKSPTFIAAQENPACDSKAVVRDGWVNITWTA